MRQRKERDWPEIFKKLRATPPAVIAVIVTLLATLFAVLDRNDQTQQDAYVQYRLSEAARDQAEDDARMSKELNESKALHRAAQGMLASYADGPTATSFSEDVNPAWLRDRLLHEGALIERLNKMPIPIGVAGQQTPTK